MIKELYIDGFKSLVDFKIEFTDGLNVIIGPNGVGKTNICQAMSILASMPSNSLKDVLNQLGGANSVFTKGDKNKIRIITIIANGEFKFKFKTKNESSEEEFHINYEYKTTIKLQKNGILRIGENLNIKRKNQDGEFILILTVSNKSGKFKYIKENEDLLGDFQLSQDKLSLRFDDDDNIWGIMPKISLVCHAIGRDLFRIRSINIDPNIARQACDIVDPDKMQGNGKFLANALFALTKSKGKLDEINSIMEQSLPCFVEIKPEISQISMKRHFTLIDNQNNKFSSNSLSDGTIKLLGLLVGVINQEEYTMIIEEPENYLHPNVHRLLVDYLRETFDDGACILTSHSETILNLINPEELIICYLDNNSTRCKRIEDVDSIKEAISESGFGCGYHYVSGGFSSL